MRTFTPIMAWVCLSLPAGALAELRLYDVDEKYRQEIYGALDGVLQEERQPFGRVERLPTGQLLIDATPEVHEQIEAILDAIAERQTAAAPQITLRYWAVLGSPNAADGAGVPELLGDVLDEIEAVHGDLGFRVLGNAALVTESGQSGELEGEPLTVVQQTYVQDTVLNAHIQITFTYPRYIVPVGDDAFRTQQSESQNVELQTTLEAGEFVVLGESTLGENSVILGENAIDDDKLDGTVFYIVHWPGEE